MSKTNFDELLERELRDPEFARRYESAGRKFNLAQQLYDRRIALGLSQTELARRVGTTQQQISRLEQASYRGSVTTLERVAEALGATVEITLKPIEAAKPAPRRRKASKAVAAKAAVAE